MNLTVDVAHLLPNQLAMRSPDGTEKSDTSSRPQTRFVLCLFLEEEFWGIRHRVGICGEGSWMRTHGREVMEEHCTRLDLTGLGWTEDNRT